ncbi:hypothetical protein I7X12_06500 [Halosimplex litoreum]|uniref:Uncharacterized protein n=1 Tax=Halosimplex litoreum TaxID=1198301 RepID=A0A7T3G0V5_9EURY|nr:hypothetical protein [Halosimplex litoreum]QPV64261.1 hypothetical protein I7X12_06500 [Halosimplex litoreum]
MATSDGARRTREHSAAGSRLSRYDLLLVVIPAAFLLALVGSLVSALPASVFVAGASVIGGLAVADGLFVNPPGRGR